MADETARRARIAALGYDYAAQPKDDVAACNLCGGRDYVIPDDVKAVSGPVLGHRLVVRPEAAARGLTADMAISEVFAAVPVPVGR